MIASIVKAWMAGKDSLRAKWSEYPPIGYSALVRDVVAMLSEHMEEHDKPDPDRISKSDYGDYQGANVFVIGGSGYQPYRHYVVAVSYGSCSGCDSFQAALDGSQTVNDMMILALHIVQKMKEVEP